MLRTSRASIGQFGLVWFALGIVISAATGGFPMRLGFRVLSLPGLFWLVGLGCGISSRGSRIGKLAIWLNAAPFAVNILWALYVALLLIFAGPIH